MEKKIYLVGFMGTGKTTIGRELAKVMGRKFLDTDQVLEKRFGKSVNEISLKMERRHSARPRENFLSNSPRQKTRL